MKKLALITIFFALCVKIWAAHQILPLEQCKKWNHVSKLDSVVVYFVAENKHLSFKQTFSQVGNVHGSRQIVLRQTELDRSHFKRALAIVKLAVNFFLSDNNIQGGEINQSKDGLLSTLYFDKHIPSHELWRNMYKTFSLVKESGLADQISIHAYYH